MKNYKKQLLETIIFILGELAFILNHIQSINLNDEYKNRIIIIKNEIYDLMDKINEKINGGNEK